MESEFERVSREGGDASNLSVAVTRAFGDVDEMRFGKYTQQLSLLHLSLFYACCLPWDVYFYCLLILAGQWKKRERPQCSALRFELHRCWPSRHFCTAFMASDFKASFCA